MTSTEFRLANGDRVLFRPSYDSDDDFVGYEMVVDHPDHHCERMEPERLYLPEEFVDLVSHYASDNKTRVL
ncbi:hypothetical protein CGX12_07530 [Zobellella denitrificans]|jgi:hypothetical protein|uniref:Uncharacterized protein n=1 Tax=Zobellella denitrificans TaxID=347534 RepID=A0A231N1H7_9GAMM|nr:hypothetical protein [Zobellella denitrificans]ATG72960.1 hypothetical protein AN401_03050 [Zobellella denitrificans]OXS15736.1 hypothetical protein CGX12_07530 [Zobellella denitrificans]